MARTLVLLLPGLSKLLLQHMPHATALGRHFAQHPAFELRPLWPALTCPMQATLTTGVDPSAHGIIANGLPTYRDGADLTDPANLTAYRRQVSFWEQSNGLLDARRVWKRDGRRTALLFLQNAMPTFGQDLATAAADIVLTPKPEHGPDGRLTSLLWSNPPGLAQRVQAELGPFPLMHYWGPLAGLPASAWIGRAAAKIWTEESPDLQLTYVPHLDYDLQRFGPASPQAARAVADLATALEPVFAAAGDARVLVLSEYAIDPVSRAIAPNAALLESGHLRLTTDAEGNPAIDYATSDAWVMCDHQIGHVYLRPEVNPAEIRSLLASIGLEILLPRPIAHIRAGDTQVQAPPDAWLDYRWWADAAEPPGWARTVDIHRKPGYDPLELFADAATRTIASDSTLIRGSHGRTDGTRGVISGPGITADQGALDVAALLMG